MREHTDCDCWKKGIACLCWWRKPRQLEQQVGHLVRQANDVAWHGDGLRGASLFIQAAQVAMQLERGEQLAADLARRARDVLATFIMHAEEPPR